MVPQTESANIFQDRVCKDSCTLPPGCTVAAVVESPKPNGRSPFLNQLSPSCLQEEEGAVRVLHPEKYTKHQTQLTKLSYPSGRVVPLFNFRSHGEPHVSQTFWMQPSADSWTNSSRERTTNWSSAPSLENTKSEKLLQPSAARFLVQVLLSSLVYFKGDDPGI